MSNVRTGRTLDTKGGLEGWEVRPANYAHEHEKIPSMKIDTCNNDVEQDVETIGSNYVIISPKSVTCMMP